jgi:hypothetical protein
MRILHDPPNGSFDLAHVIGVLPIPRQTTTAGQVVNHPPTAKIIIHGGHTFSVNLPHEQVLAAWLHVKESERHPCEASNPPSSDPSSGETPQ